MGPELPQPPELPEDAARPQEQNLGERIAELSALTGGLAHEIRNPLSTLKVNLQLLDEDWKQLEAQDDGLAPSSRDVVGRSRRRIAALLGEADHLERILQDFLRYMSERELRRAPHDLNTIVGDLVDFYGPQAKAHAVDLRFSPHDQPVICDIDQSLVKQALLNLLINAQQAMPDGGAIYLRAATHGTTSARVDVIDTGPGIPEEQREKVFQAYFSTKKAGSGLGLATSRRIIQDHGGQILLYSAPPHGSCFTILLPLAATK